MNEVDRCSKRLRNMTTPSFFFITCTARVHAHGGGAGGGGAAARDKNLPNKSPPLKLNSGQKPIKCGVCVRVRACVCVRVCVCVCA